MTELYKKLTLQKFTVDLSILMYLSLFADRSVPESFLLQSRFCFQCHYVDYVCEISAEMLISHCHCYQHCFKLLLYCKWSWLYCY